MCKNTHINTRMHLQDETDSDSSSEEEVRRRGRARSVCGGAEKGITPRPNELSPIASFVSVSA